MGAHRQRETDFDSIKGKMMTSPKAVNSGQTERDALEQIARRIHYPACWDTAAYPTLASALVECAAWYDLRCGECEAGSIVRAASPAPASPSGEDSADGATLPAWFDAFLTNVCEIPDRNSPEDEPEAIIATLEELKSCALNAIESVYDEATPEAISSAADAVQRIYGFTGEIAEAIAIAVIGALKVHCKSPLPRASEQADEAVTLPYVERFRESHGEGGGVYPDDEGDFMRYSDFVELFAARAKEQS